MLYLLEPMFVRNTAKQTMTCHTRKDTDNELVSHSTPRNVARVVYSNSVAE